MYMVNLSRGQGQEIYMRYKKSVLWKQRERVEYEKEEQFQSRSKTMSGFKW